MRELVESCRGGESGELLKRGWQSGLRQCIFSSLIA